MRSIFYEFKMEFLRTIRYRTGIAADLVIYTLLLCFFFASNTGHTFAQEYGNSNYKALLLLGYIAWSFSSAAVSAISSLLLMELQRGTLFFKLNAKMPLQFLYLGDLASAVCIQTFVILLYSAITHFIFGVNYSVNGTIIAALFICTLGMYGIGLIIAGLSLYYKRIGSIVLLVQLFLLFVTDTLPTSSAIRQITQVIPLTACNRVVRNSYVKDSAGTDFLLLCVYSAVWFLIGYAVFEIFIRRAKEKGNLLLY